MQKYEKRAISYSDIVMVCLHEAIVAATVGAIVAPTGCGDDRLV